MEAGLGSALARMPEHPGLSPTLTGFTSGVSPRRLKLFKSLVSTDFTTRALHDALEPTPLSAGSCLAPEHRGEPRSYALDARKPLPLLTFHPGGKSKKDLTKQILSLLCLPISPPGRVPDYIGRPYTKKGKRIALSLFQTGAAEESRTLDLYLGKVSLYQLSYCRMSLGGAGRSRTDLHGFAIRCITALLPRPAFKLYYMRKAMGFPRKIWSGRRVSNSRPIPWQGIALPTELLPRQTERAL